MNKQDYDKYYQQGGSYVIPVEIFNELFEDYECFKNDCKKYKEVIDKAINYIYKNYGLLDKYQIEVLEDILKEVEQMNTIKNETGTYIELPKEKIKFVSKEAEIMFDLSMENDYLKKENQELKKHLEVPKQCNLKTIEDYKSYYEDTTKEEILKDTYIDYCAYVNLAHRYVKLKKQLEEQDKKLFFTKNELEMRQKSIDNKLNQQKEFIEYMNKTIEELECENVDDEEMKGYLIQRIDTFKEIFSKYKEIIGDDK